MVDEAGPARARHWNEAYAARGATGASWFQPVPTVSLALIEALGVETDARVVDVGGGASRLADELVARGFRDVTVLDVAETSLETVRDRLPSEAPVTLLVADALAWEPESRYDLWHDRAVFHFLVRDDERVSYLESMRAAIEPGGAAILGTFAADGPETCSGLPVRRHSVADLTAALGDAFELVEARREEHVTPRGTVQPFTWVAGRLR